MTSHERRRSLRLADYDYAQSGAYFVTIVTQRRSSLFGDVIDAEMRLNGAGHMVCDLWHRLPTRFPSVELDEFIVMPNHVHGVLLLGTDVEHVGAPLVGARSRNASDRSAESFSLGRVVGAFKSLTTVAYARGVRESRWKPFDQRLWQRNFYEHIVRDERSLERIREYILANPARWEVDPENPNMSTDHNRGRPQRVAPTETVAGMIPCALGPPVALSRPAADRGVSSGWPEVNSS